MLLRAAAGGALPHTCSLCPHTSHLQADPPEFSRIPPDDIVGVTVILLTCSYREKVRLGWGGACTGCAGGAHVEPADAQRQAKCVAVIRVWAVMFVLGALPFRPGYDVCDWCPSFSYCRRSSFAWATT